MDRILIDGERLIISQPDKIASPALPDADKVFDSDWAFGGGIVAMGVKEFIASNAISQTGPPHIIDFPEQPEPPCVLVYNVVPPDAPVNWQTGPSPIKRLVVRGPYLGYAWNLNDANNVRYDKITVTTNQIIIPNWDWRNKWVPSDSYFFRYTGSTKNPAYHRAFLYVVMGF